MYLRRSIENKVKELSLTYPVIMISGQRQVGKSTMLYHIKDKDRRYISFDDFTARNLAQTDPDLFFETYGTKLLIDEFQRVPSILLTIKKIIDKKKLDGEKVNGMFWLTGSQKFKMMKDIGDTLVGRIALLDMSSLTQNEIEDNGNGFFIPNIDDLKTRKFKEKNIHEVFKDIFNGGMPAIIVEKQDRETYYRNYLNTYIERDVKELSQIGKTDEFIHLLIYMAANTSQELKYDTIAKEIGISAPTAKAWISILEASGIIYILRPYYNKVTDRMVKTPKAYFLDTGLAAYLSKWPNAEVLEFGASAGAFFETYIVSEIIKNYYNNNKELNLYYYRDFDQKEIDLLIVDAINIYPIEIKKAVVPNKPDKNLSVLKKFNLNVQPLITLCMTEDFIPLNKNCYLCPIGKI